MPSVRHVASDVVGATRWCSLWVLVGFVLGAGNLIILAVAARLAGMPRAETKPDDPR
jgi:membrane protein DedA with SNARE-associated domain